MKTITRAAIAASVALVAVAALSGCGIRYEGNTTSCTVTDKYVAVQNKRSEKRVSTSCGVFAVEDELSQGDWFSADRYAQIVVGKTYDFEAYGWRNGFLSTFPNIATVTESR